MKPVNDKLCKCGHLISAHFHGAVCTVPGCDCPRNILDAIERAFSQATRAAGDAQEKPQA